MTRTATPTSVPPTLDVANYPVMTWQSTRVRPHCNIQPRLGYIAPPGDWTAAGTPRCAVRLVGRSDECRLLERLLDDVKAGHARALIVRGEPGIGKTALFDHVIASAGGFQIVRATGIESEMELVFAGLHQLCAPLLGGLPLLPEPQRDALGIAFGLALGSAPDRFLIGLALLGLLSDVAEQVPLLCVIDDTQWLDRASVHALSFVARRLLADRVCLLFGTRQPTEDLRGLPELVVMGLGDLDARALLASVVRGPLDDQVRDRVVAETHGNPLALLEWPRGLSPAELAGGFGMPRLLPFAGQIEESFRRRWRDLPTLAQLFMTVAAAEPTGDAVLVRHAVRRLGVADTDASPAIDTGLVEVGTTVRFRHPAVRSVAYAAAAISDRRDAHQALADVTDPVAAPDRRAWHRALSVPGPDEEVAAELERSASSAQARGGLAAAAAFLERSAALTLDPEQRAHRMIAAAAAYLEAGAADSASKLLAAAEAGPIDEFCRAQVESLRGDAASGWGHIGGATDVLLSAARRLEQIDVRLARDTYLGAILVADQASDLTQGATVVDAALAARAAPTLTGGGDPHDLLLDGLALAHSDGPAAAAPLLREALTTFAAVQLSPGEGWLLGPALTAAALLWDYDAFYSLGARFLQVARDLGALRTLPWALGSRAQAHVWSGDLATAASLVAEMQSALEATGDSTAPWAVADLAAWRGREAEAKSAIAAGIDHALAHGQGGAIKVARSAEATLLNGLGQFEGALIAARKATSRPLHRSAYLALRELVEAAVRSGQPAVAAEAVERLSESTQTSGTDWALGVEARSRALLITGDAAEALYHEAIERLDRSPLRPEAARAHLLYGEWLRREKRRVEAREQLRTAHGLFDTMGARAFAERARIELAATGERARSRRPAPTADLTPQERQIAQMAANGATNQEIASQLFLSANTVDYHLRKVFQKLLITRRGQLHNAFATAPP